MSDWKKICALGDVPVLGARVVDSASHGRIAVFRSAADEVFAVLDKCPHKAGPLSQGIVHGNTVTCPLHSWVFSLESGKAQGADEGTVRAYPLRNIDGALFIALSSLNAAAE